MARAWNAWPRGHDTVTARASAALAHEHFTDSGRLDDCVRPVVGDSWRRSADHGVDPDTSVPRVELDTRELRDHRDGHPLAAVMPMLRHLLVDTAPEPQIVAVGDAEGCLLWVEGDHGLRTRAEAMHFVEGANWHEDSAGTNAPGVALAIDREVQIFAAEHFSRGVHAWSCSAAPLHDPGTGRVLGFLDLTGSDHLASPAAMALVRAAASAADAELRALYAAGRLRAEPRSVTAADPVPACSAAFAPTRAGARVPVPRGSPGIGVRGERGPGTREERAPGQGVASPRTPGTSAPGPGGPLLTPEAGNPPSTPGAGDHGSAPDTRSLGISAPGPRDRPFVPRPETLPPVPGRGARPGGPERTTGPSPENPLTPEAGNPPSTPGAGELPSASWPGDPTSFPAPGSSSPAPVAGKPEPSSNRSGRRPVPVRDDRRPVTGTAGHRPAPNPRLLETSAPGTDGRSPASDPGEHPPAQEQGNRPSPSGPVEGNGGPGGADLHVLGRDGALLTAGAGTTGLSPRHSEILLLLARHPAGLTGGALGALLTDRGTRPVTLRAEMVRLRRLLGRDLVASRPYRLLPPLRTDADRVRALLADGALTEALRAYPGHLLPSSTAPGVAEARAQLQAELCAVLETATDPGVLVAWAEHPAWREDPRAVAAAVAALDPGSPRRRVLAGRLAWLAR